MAVTVQPDGAGGLRLGARETLFPMRGGTILPMSNRWSYSPHPDRQRFLVDVPDASFQQTVTVVTNWRDTLGEVAAGTR